MFQVVSFFMLENKSQRYFSNILKIIVSQLREHLFIGKFDYLYKIPQKGDLKKQNDSIALLQINQCNYW
ncbi:hypothetical protein ASG22_19730 [Chryseobacterium sp. Leaf405]|nr:hypothetical protein ASG22_19730 [Chryseobacterium sp. Leaf405]